MKKIMCFTIVLSVIFSCLTMPAMAEGSEVVANATITASQFNSSYPLENIYDGVLTTITSISPNGREAGYGAWIKVDLGVPQVISEIAIRSRRDVDQESSRSEWVLQVANKSDFSDAVTVGEKPDPGPMNSDLEVSMTSKIPYRYVRVASYKYMVVAEFEIELAPVVAGGGSVYEDIAGTTIEDKLAILSHLELLDEVSPIEFGTKILVDRGYAAQLICNLANLKDGITPEKIYADVPVDHKYAPYITCLYNRGFINANAFYNVDDEIRLIDFLKLVCYTLGYQELLEMSDRPETDIITLTNRMKYLKNVEYDDIYGSVNKEQAAMIMYNAINSQIFGVDSITDYGDNFVVNYSMDKNQSYLYSTFGLVRGEGIVEETSITNLKKPSYNGKGHLKVGGVIYEDKTEILKNKIGRNIEYYYNKDYEVVCAWETDNEYLKIDAENLGNTSATEFTYWDENDKERKARLKRGFDVIKNGAATLSWDMTDFKAEEAELTLIDNDNDGRYDVVLFDEPEIFVVSSVFQDDDKLSIVTKNIDSNPIKSYDDIKDLTINRNNGLAKANSIKENDIAYVYVSDCGDVVRIEAYSNVVTGTVNSIGSDDLEVDGKKYLFSEYYLNHKNDMEAVQVGKNFSFALNNDKELVWVLESVFSEEDGVIAYICADRTSDDFENTVFKIYTINKEFKYLKVADKVKINGVPTRGEGLDGSPYVDKVALVKIVNNEIKSLDIEQPKDTGSNLDLAYEPVDGDRYYKEWYGIFDKNNVMVMPVFEPIKMFVIPDSREDKYFDVVPISTAFVSTNKVSEYSTSAKFYIPDDFGSPKFGVAYKADLEQSGTPVLTIPSSPSLLVNCVKQKLNKDDEVVYALEGINLADGKNVEVELSDSITHVYDSGRLQQDLGSSPSTYLDSMRMIMPDKTVALDADPNDYKVPVNDIETGDIVRYQMLGDVACAAELVFDCSRVTSTDFVSNVSGSYYATAYSNPLAPSVHYKLMYGTITKIGSGRIQVSMPYKNGENSVPASRIFEIGTAKILEKTGYEFTNVKGLSSVSEIKADQKVLILTTSSTLRAIVFYD